MTDATVDMAVKGGVSPTAVPNPPKRSASAMAFDVLLWGGLALVLIMLVRPSGLWPSPNKEDRPNAALAREE